jgi:hypothetical protein
MMLSMGMDQEPEQETSIELAQEWQRRMEERITAVEDYIDNLTDGDFRSKLWDRRQRNQGPPDAGERRK